MQLRAQFFRSGTVVGIFVCVLAAGLLVWIGYRTVAEWRETATHVASQRAEAAASLLAAALSRDMRGVQALVLASADLDGIVSGPATDLLHPIASAFARYPYPEAFFRWHVGAEPSVDFYARADRVPSWLMATEERRFPVLVGGEPRIGERLVTRVTQDIDVCRRFSVFQMDVGGQPYQVVAVVSYGDVRREHASAVLGFMVNLDWARQVYFRDLAAQVSRIEGDDSGIALMIFDQHDEPVVGTGPRRAIPSPLGSRTFPVAFFDPLLVALDPPPDLTQQSWTAIASAESDPALAAVQRGARRTLSLAILAGLALTTALLLSMRAAYASANLATMRSEFVATVTHELKTPISNIRAINEILASERSTEVASREYAQMAIDETKRLTRLVDNILCYAELADVSEAYSFESVSVRAAVERAVREFAVSLDRSHFEVEFDIPEDTPHVKADLTALGLVLNNLIDNAIRYSGQTHFLSIKARRNDAGVTIDVADKGIGIPPDELPRVTEKFFRGRGSNVAGTGLGLAIVDRIIHDHSGSVDIRSDVALGTTVSITLPAGSDL